MSEFCIIKKESIYAKIGSTISPYLNQRHRQENIDGEWRENAQNVYQSVDIRNQIKEQFDNGQLQVREIHI